ncbi:DUF4411 family protein [Corynebacterium riegelii]|uniref:DUF4411 family protein n=1 Tax=Corynebacterium riegelii TaxID=156976 RepID=UPI002152125A|nr:DUF4411 family protein [Corynebacterium riegelii]
MYLVDTNFLGHLEHYYPGTVFPSLWLQLEQKLFTPHVCFHQEVDKELQRWSHPGLAGITPTSRRTRFYTLTS